MSESMEMTCIVCPRGCHMLVEAEGGVYKSVSGNFCRRGESYAKAEIEAPTRMVTSTVRIEGGILPVIPVRTASPIPKGDIMKCMGEIARAVAKAPIEVGDVVIRNVAGSGVDIIASRSMGKAEK